MSDVKFPLSTEKATRLMQSENKLVFVVDNSADKNQVKEFIEKEFNAKVVSVNTFVTKGIKKAYVKFAPEVQAIDIATKLGLV